MSSIAKVEIRDLGGNQVPATTSLSVAEFTGKEHKNVLRDIEELIKSGEFSSLKFELSTYSSDRGKTYKMYILDETLTTILLMGLTGKEAIKWKLAYTKEFMRMREENSNTRIIREKGDQFALADRLQKKLLLAKRREAGKSEDTDHFAMMNISKATNRLALGKHEKDIRQNMNKKQALNLSKAIDLTFDEILSGNIEIKNIEVKLKDSVLLGNQTKKISN